MLKKFYLLIVFICLAPALHAHKKSNRKKPGNRPAVRILQRENNPKLKPIEMKTPDLYTPQYLPTLPAALFVQGWASEIFCKRMNETVDQLPNECKHPAIVFKILAGGLFCVIGTDLYNLITRPNSQWEALKKERTTINTVRKLYEHDKRMLAFLKKYSEHFDKYDLQLAQKILESEIPKAKQ